MPSDPKWKGAIERALGSWDSVEEWADYIAFLSRVQKAVKHPSSTKGSLPLAPIMAEHLARCLDPALPAGVHQVTLDVYATVLAQLGKESLADSVAIWLPGLLPLVSYAAFNVKPKLLELIDKVIVPASRPRELIRPLLLACLPSLDDESSEGFNEIHILLENLRSRLNDDVLWWQAIYITVASASEVRLGALSYMGRHLPLFIPKDPQDSKLDAKATLAIEPESSLLLNALVAGINDSNVLVPRGFLDILVKHLPLHSPVFGSCSEKDFRAIIKAAISTLLRKDMSLNRRLWVWLLGPTPGFSQATDEPQEKPQTQDSRLDYFKRHASQTLVQVVLASLETNFDETCQIAHGLMDRWEIAAELVAPLLIPALTKARGLHLKSNPEVLASVSKFVDGIEPVRIWSTVLELIENDNAHLVEFVASSLNISEPDMLVHVPYALLAVLEHMQDSDEKWLPSALHLLALIPLDLLQAPEKLENSKTYSKALAEYYNEASSDGETTPSMPLDEDTLSSALISNALKLYCANPNYKPIFVQLLGKTNSFEFRDDTLIQSLLQRPQDADVFCFVKKTLSFSEKRSYVAHLCNHVFHTLLGDGQNQVEVLNALWATHEESELYLVPSALATGFAQITKPACMARAFRALWLHSVDRSDFADLLSKISLLFLDLLEGSQDHVAACDAVLRNTVLPTNTAEKLLRLVLDPFKEDNAVSVDTRDMNYRFRIATSLLSRKVFRRIYTEKFADIMIGYALGELVEHKTDKLCVSSILNILSHTIFDSGYPHKRTNEIVSLVLKREIPISINLVAFVSKALSHIHNETSFDNQESLAYLTFNFVLATIQWVQSEEGFSNLETLMSRFLTAHRDRLWQVIVPLTNALSTRLPHAEDLKSPNLFSSLDLAVQIVTLIEKVFSVKQPDYPEETVSQNTSQILGNVISGVFSVEAPESPNKVILYEASEIVMNHCCSLWLFLDKFRSSKSSMQASNYTTLIFVSGRLKSRLKRLFSQIYNSMPIETVKLAITNCDGIRSAVKMIHAMDNTRYKTTIEVIASNLTTAGADTIEKSVDRKGLALFLTYYVHSLENDAMEDVWQLLYTLMNEISSKPQQYLDILPCATDLSVRAAEKLEATNFGRTKRVRRESGDLVQKLFTSTTSEIPADQLFKSEPDVLSLAFLKQSSRVLADTEKQSALLSRLVALVSQHFKKDQWDTIELSVFTLASTIVTVSPSARVWKQSIGEIVFDPRIFTLQQSQIAALAAAIDSYVQADKDRLIEFLGRITTYGSNSVLFGWSSNHTLTNENLQRLALLLLCSNSLPVDYAKLVNQLTTVWNNVESIPTICLLLRAIVISANQVQLIPIYRFISSRLHILFTTVLETLGSSENQTPLEVILAASKLLDQLLAQDCQYFQCYEWLFICDSSDAIYPHDEQRTGGLIDKLASHPNLSQLSSHISVEDVVEPEASVEKRRPLLPERASARDLPIFFNKLSVSFYESIYLLRDPDMDYIRERTLSEILESN